MNKRIHSFFTNDHRRLEDLLRKATEDPDTINMEYYHPFRIGLLTHIKMEEKILFPAAQKANGDVALSITAKLRLDHGAITSLMAIYPTHKMINALWHILDEHDLLEEKPDGMYDACEALTKHQTDEILEQLKQVTEVPVHPPSTQPYVLEAGKRAVARAGYDYDSLAK